ncbi:hypothetical protein HPHPM2_0962 [Helicobacter pylori Hp M2]|nr:hypothetical protein HPHPH24B_0993 [Helicobacter pylori Hp H-24b]EJC21314.1 hypothetical protein HPHPH24C_0874 [Helicobacter pylori Hp H-24c]EJC38078.1 hypothetical protein HPHPM1_1081 [Helicobacter pylori Hp M1]EJC41816.1 hypothetical protein HPHPM2_0962 [Helicobacter pylori Hp M2]EJC43371.1 hypothetical protein HPHPM4_1090 [Helicobacter pylori Hp M4]EJC44512.1 hypothetical protein HPHPM3_0993 [Helicobacter pylori Hp M3]EJC46594.1 hypothetical protein HPHPM5_1128 [Helicobacter pylori Hp M
MHKLTTIFFTTTLLFIISQHSAIAKQKGITPFNENKTRA